jgi:preprotein translocase subunit Sec63
VPRIEEEGKEVVKVKQEVALNKNNNYYGILEVDQDATEEEIKNAYRRLALK